MRVLPDEILREIFTHLDAHDLLKLTRVCRRFREIVNTSQALTAKLTLCFEKRKRNAFIGRRRYRRLNVGYVEQVHFNILRFIGADITWLTFSHYNFKLETIRQVLALCPGVKTLKFKEILYLHGVNEVGASTKVPAYSDCNVEVVQSDPRIFKILKECRARSVKFTCCEYAHRHYFMDFLAFMREQDKLEELTLEEFYGPCVGLGLVLFHNDTLAGVKFRLKSLTFRSNQLSPYGNISSPLFFELFMGLHCDTLECLEADKMDDFDFTAYLQRCKRLNSLNVGNGMVISSRQVLKNVKNVQVEQPRMNLLRCFPHVESLHIANSFYDPHGDIVKWHLLMKCSQIHTLVIEDVSLDDFPPLPSLKRLRLEFYVSLDSEVFARNPQLEDVTFIECRDMSTRKSKVLKIIVDYLRELRLLTIADSRRVDPAALEYVKRKCTQLKYLRVFRDVECTLPRI